MLLLYLVNLAERKWQSLYALVSIAISAQTGLAESRRFYYLLLNPGHLISDRWSNLFNMPSKKPSILHTVSKVWGGGVVGEESEEIYWILWKTIWGLETSES